VGKVAGRIEREDLAEIFARAERIRSERGGGRLGRVMLDELMARAKELATGPKTGRMKRLRLDQTAIVDPPEARDDVVEGFSASGIVEGFSEPAPPPAPKPRLDLAASGDELGVLPEAPVTRDDPRAQPKPAPSLRQLSTLLDERSSGDDEAGGLDSILAQATELTFEGYEDELASLLEETYDRYQRGSFDLFKASEPKKSQRSAPRSAPAAPAPTSPPASRKASRPASRPAPAPAPKKRNTPLANWRPPTLDASDVAASRSGARSKPPPQPEPPSQPTPPPPRPSDSGRRSTTRLDSPPRPILPPNQLRPSDSGRRPRPEPEPLGLSDSQRHSAPTRPYGPADSAHRHAPGPLAQQPRVHRGPYTPQAGHPVHDPFEGDPFELVPPRGDPATETRQAFATQLERYGAPGMLERKNPPRGQPASLPIRIVFDPGRSVFGALLEPRLEPGDRFQLRTGQVFGVVASEFVFVADVPCYQEIRAEPLGSLRAPLHTSWE
jgi:hypothetical protein